MVANNKRESALSYSPDHSTDEGVLRRLKCASYLCAFFLTVEVVGGLLSHSLAVLSDAAHLFADLTSFIVAVFAANLARLPPTVTSTYGFKRTEALAALFSMSCLAVVSFFLGLDAILRIVRLSNASRDENGNFEDTSILVDGKLMSFIASIGVLVNVSLAFILGENHVHLPGGDHSHSHDHESDDHREHEHHHHVHEPTSKLDHHDHSHNSHHNHDHDHVTDEEANVHSDSSDDHSSHSSDDHNHRHHPPHEHEHEHHDHHHDERTSLLSHGNDKKVENQQRNINLHAAYLHVLTDLVQSILVLIAGIIIWKKPSLQVVDPICTLVFCAIVAKSTKGVIISSISVLMNQVPAEVKWEDVHDAISAVEGVSNVHMLHIWAISHGSNSLSVHADADDVEEALQALHEICRKFNISHSTIQLQPSNLDGCVTCGFKNEGN